MIKRFSKALTAAAFVLAATFSFNSAEAASSTTVEFTQDLPLHLEGSGTVFSAAGVVDVEVAPGVPLPIAGSLVDPLVAGFHTQIRASVARNEVLGSEVGSGIAFHDKFAFNVSGPTPVKLAFAPTVQNPSKFANLSFVLTDSLGGLVKSITTTNALGEATDELAKFWIDLVSDNYVLNVIGTLISSGTSTYDVEISTVPLPPAAIAFGSALIGMGFLGRRRKKA